MRRPERLDYFYEEIKNLHKENVPDWREGQFFINFIKWVTTNKKRDLFFMETEETLKLLREYIDMLKEQN